MGDTEGNVIDILVVKEGDGAIPGGQSAVEIEYTGHLENGKQFIAHREVIQLGKKMNIKGLEQAVTRIKVGSQIKLWIPSRLAYGARGAGALIPPNADLTFHLQMHRIVKQNEKRQLTQDNYGTMGNDNLNVPVPSAPPVNNVMDPNDAVYVWLDEVGMAQYASIFKAEGYETKEDMDSLTKEDMIDLKGSGITKQMHIKRILTKANENSGGRT